MPHGEIDVFAREVDVMQGRGDPQIDAGMRLGKSAQAVDQPFGGEVRRGAHGEHAGGLALQQTLGADRDAVERVAKDGEVFAARLGDDEPLALAIEELDPELEFQRLDLVADGALGDAKLLGRAREAFMPRGGLEGLESIQRREAPAHGDPHEENSVRVEKRCFAGNRFVVLLIRLPRNGSQEPNAVWSEKMANTWPKDGPGHQLRVRAGTPLFTRSGSSSSSSRGWIRLRLWRARAAKQRRALANWRSG